MTTPLSQGRFPQKSEDPRPVADANKLILVLREAGAQFEVRCLPVRSSYISCLHECPRKFLFRYRMGLRRKGAFSFALDTGTFYHEIMAGMLYHQGDFGRACTVASGLLSARMDGWKKLADKSMLMPDGTPLENLLAKSERSFSLAKVMAEISIPQFFGKVLEDYAAPLVVEQAIETKMQGIRQPIRCKPDIILKHKTKLETMLVNYKTLTGSTQTRAATNPYEYQPKIERLCTAAAFPNFPPTLYLHNLIAKCTLRFPAKKYPTWDDYLTSVRAWYKEQAQKSPNDPPMLQSLTALVGPIMDEEFEVILREASHACSAMPSPARFYRNSSACFGRFGRSPCPYLTLCKSSMDAWGGILKDRFFVHYREDDEDKEPTT